VPTVLRDGPYRFFFYSADGNEPPHIHIERDACTAKFWLNLVRFDNSEGFSRREIANVETLVEENEKVLLKAWYEYFGT
jgi:hypothetical protein